MDEKIISSVRTPPSDSKYVIDYPNLLWSGGFIITVIIFAVIHLFLWNSSIFSTILEHSLWRGTSLATITIPISGELIGIGMSSGILPRSSFLKRTKLVMQRLYVMVRICTICVYFTGLILSPRVFMPL